MLRTMQANNLPQSDVYRVFLYGANRSGKTHFAGTWPNPVFVVPSLGLNELKTVSDQELLVVPFNGLEDCAKQLEELSTAIRKKSKGLPYIPKTIVFDNLTTANQLFLDELENDGGDRKVERNQWGRLRANMVAYMRILHGISSCHVIWIAHPAIERVHEVVGGRPVEHTIGTFSIQGAAKDLIPGNCDLLLYSEDKDFGVKGTGYLLHGRKAGIWPAGVRLARAHQKKPFTRLGPTPSPSYDELAKVLGLPSCDEVEEALWSGHTAARS